MTDLNFTIKRIFPGTEKQKAVGIHATFSMDLENSDGIIASFSDLMLRQTREGKYYIESGFRTYQGKDKEGQPKDRKMHYVKLFPEEKNWTKQDAIVALVLAEMKAGNTPAPAKTTPNKPAPNKTPGRSPAPVTPTDEPW